MTQTIVAGVDPLVLMDMSDITSLEVIIKADGKVLWLNTPGGCVFRACRIGRIMVYDERKVPYGEGITDPAKEGKGKKE